MSNNPNELQIDVVQLGKDAAFVMRAQPVPGGGFDIKANAAGISPREVIGLLRSYADALEQRVAAAEARTELN